MGEAALAGHGLAADAATTQPTPGTGIGFDAVTVSYKGAAVLRALTLSIAPGEIMAIIGPSGSGKTTALRAVAGFVRPSAGRVLIGKTDVTTLPPRARDIGVVVQNYALFPHMRVDANVAFGLHARNEKKDVIAARVAECLQMVGMAGYAARYPRQLSGGQQQRIAIARALAIRPRVLLLDEPLSALDAQIRLSMLGELSRLHRALPHLTILYVTHDQTEALTLADRIAILRDGALVAEGPSQMLYREPPNRFAAEFLGRANLLQVRVAAQHPPGNLVSVHLAELTLHAVAPRSAVPPGPGLLCLRPHAISLAPQPGSTNAIPATVTGVQWQGELHAIEAEAFGQPLRLVCTPLRDPPLPGDPVTLHFNPDDATLLPPDPPIHV